MLTEQQWSRADAAFRRSRQSSKVFAVCIGLCSLLVYGLTRIAWGLVPAPSILGLTSVEMPAPPWNVDFCPNPFPRLCFSGSRDLVNTMAYGACQYFDKFLLSVRSARCRARLVLFTIEGQQFTPEYVRVIALTETEVIYRRWGRQYRDFQRNSWLREYIIQHRDSFDRIFTCDAMDVIFERDPFEFLTGRRMIFTEECAAFKWNPGNTAWVRSAWGDEFADTLGEKYVLNWGTMYGDPDSYIKFFEVVWSNRNWRRTQFDQAILNWAVYSGALDRARVNYTLVRQFGPVLHITKCLGYILTAGPYKVLATHNYTYPHVLHQWKKRREYWDFVRDHCIMPDANWFNRSWA